MTTTELEGSLEASLTKRLRTATNATHEQLDASIMAGDPFSSRERYSLFATVQYMFHREIDAMYDDAVLDGLLPDLKGRHRLGLIAQDLNDLASHPSAASGWFDRFWRVRRACPYGRLQNEVVADTITDGAAAHTGYGGGCGHMRGACPAGSAGTRCAGRTSIRAFVPIECNVAGEPSVAIQIFV